MLPAFILSLREGVEAALVVGIVLGALRKMERPDLARYVWIGAITAGFASLLTAILLDWLGAELEGTSEMIFEGATLLLAAGVLTWMIFWMRKQSRSLKGELESEMRTAALGGHKGVFLLAFTAVVREGIELALFLAATTLTTNPVQTLSGAIVGLGTAILLGWSLFASLVRLDLRRFFAVTGVLLILFAAGLVTHSANEFIEAGWLPALVAPVWNLGSILSDQSFLGQVLSTLFGYSSSPSLMGVLAYCLYFFCVGIGLWRMNLPASSSASPS